MISGWLIGVYCYFVIAMVVPVCVHLDQLFSGFKYPRPCSLDFFYFIVYI